MNDFLMTNLVRFTEYELTLNGWFLQVAQIGSSLTWLLTQHNHLRVDCAEGINDDFTLDGLNWI